MSLRFGVLGLLAEEPLHGYEVKTRFEEMLGGTWKVNIGSVYQVLNVWSAMGSSRRPATAATAAARPTARLSPGSRG